MVDETLPADHEMIIGPVRVEADFYVRRPPTIEMRKRALPIVPPDLDPLARGLLDGLGQGLDGKSGNGRLWADDSLVVELIARKFYADSRETGAEVKITAL